MSRRTSGPADERGVVIHIPVVGEGPTEAEQVAHWLRFGAKLFQEEIDHIRAQRRNSMTDQKAMGLARRIYKRVVRGLDKAEREIKTVVDVATMVADTVLATEAKPAQKKPRKQRKPRTPKATPAAAPAPAATASA